MPDISTRFKGESAQDRLTQSTLNASDCLQARHNIGESGDSDKGIPFSVLMGGYVGKCSTAAATAAKVISVDNFPNFELVNGVEITVYFEHGNTATSPTFSVGGSSAISGALENQAANVEIGTGCWGDGAILTLKYIDVTVSGTRIQKFVILGHDVATATSEYTTYSDGRIEYVKSKVDNLLGNLIPLSYLHNNKIELFYSSTLSDYGLSSGGNGFIFSFTNAYNWNYLQVVISPLSNDYSQWSPAITLKMRAHDPVTNNWQSWQTI